jgi:TetR/AcrR family transcriptional regulator, cholesterol catabolism regulator
MSDQNATRRRILDASATLLCQKGVNGTKLSEIASMSGMLAPSLYHHFKSKEHIVKEVVLEGYYRNSHHVVAMVESLGKTATPEQRLEQAIYAHVKFLLDGDIYSATVARIFVELPDSLAQEALVAFSFLDNYWRDLIHAVEATGKSRPSINGAVARKLLLSMLDHSPEWFRSGKLTAEQIARQACDIFLRGFLAEEP